MVFELLCVIFAITVIMTIVGLVFFRKIMWVRVLITLILLFLLILTFLFSNVLIFIASPMKYSLSLSIATILIHLAIASLVIFLINGLLKNKIAKKVYIIIVSLFFVVGIGIVFSVVNDANMEEFTEYVDRTSNITTLDRESSFKINENLPHLDGATALYPVYVAFANAVYPKEITGKLFSSPDSRDDDGNQNEYVKCTTTIGAYDSIIDGKADIIFVASPSKEQEERALENNVKLEFVPIGRDGFVFFVNSINPINNVSIDEIKAIYSGEISNWKTLGERQGLKWETIPLMLLGDIRAFQRNNGSGSQTYIRKLMGNTKLKTPITEDVQDFMSGIVHSVALNYKNYRNAIGYSFRYYAQEMVDNKGVKFLSINGVYPSKESISNESYPLSGSFYAVVRDDASKEVRDFLEWIKSNEGQELVEKIGYVRVKG